MASYIGVSPPEQTGIVERYKYTGNGSTTAFSGADTNAKVLRYTSTNPILVFLNGVQLVEGTDFTKTSNTVVTFAAAPANNDDIEILTFGSFDLNSPSTIRCDLGLNTTDSPTFANTTLSGAGKLQLRDSGTYINSNADGDLDIVSDGTANESIKLTSAGGIYLQADGSSTTGTIRLDSQSGVVNLYRDGTITTSLNNEANGDVEIHTRVSNADLRIRGNDGGSDITALTFDMSAAGTATFNHDLILPNNGIIQLGDAGENIVGDGTNLTISSSQNLIIDTANELKLDSTVGINLLDNGTSYGLMADASGDFVIKSQQSDKNLIIKGNDGGSTVNALTFDMSEAGTATFNNDVKLGDNGTITLGAGDDLQVYHDGTNSYIKDAGSGDLKIESNFLRTVDTNGHTTATFSSGGVNLRHTNNVKLTTTSTGATVTGNLTAGELISDTGNNYSNVKLLGDDGTNGDSFRFSLNNNNKLVLQRSPDSFSSVHTFGCFEQSGNICFLHDLSVTGDLTVDTNTLHVDASTGNVGIGTTSPTGGTARTLQISHSGSARLLLENTGGGRKYGFFAGTDGKFGLYDYSGATQRLSIDTDGKFGIGTTSQSRELHVAGGDNMGIALTSSGQTNNIAMADALGSIRILQNAGALHFKTGGSANNTASGTDAMSITNSQNVVVCNDLTVSGNLTINGTTTTLNTATLDIEDKTLCIAKGAADAAAANGAGIIVDGASACLCYTSGTDSWDFNKDVILPNNKKVILGDAGENIVGDGTNLTIASSGTTKLDSVGNIILDADSGGTVIIADNGTSLMKLFQFGNFVALESMVSNKDFHIRGNDGGSYIDALTLDMSEAGAATFNDKITLGANKAIEFGDAGEYIVGDGTNLNIVSSNALGIDVPNGITLDSGSGGTVLRAGGGTTYGTLTSSSGDLSINQTTSDKDIIFTGNDGGSTITPLKLDMSAGGLVTTDVAGSTVAKWQRDSATNGELTLGFPSQKATFTASNDLVFIASGGDICLNNNTTICENLSIGNTENNHNVTISRATTNPSLIKIAAETYQPSICFTGTNSTTHGLKFQSASGDLGIITQEGKYGIGTISPLSPLHVVGAGARFESSTVSGRAIDIDADSGSVEMADNSNWLHLQRNHNGQVAIGASSTANLYVPNNAGFGAQPGAGARVVISNTSVSDNTLQLQTTEDSSSAAPILTFKRNSSSPADADYIGQLKFKGENDNDQEVTYAKITGKIDDVTDGTEDGLIEFANIKAGSNVITARLKSDNLQLLNGVGLEVAGNTTITGSLQASNFKQAGTNFTDSILLGTSTTGTLSSATCNVGVGVSALSSITSGTNNVATGFGSLKSNTTGSCNVAIGSSSLCTNNTGQLNIGIGAASLKLNTTGCAQTAIGVNSLCSNTTGVNNVAVGHNSLRCNVSGSCNVAIGYMALCCNASDCNTGIGFQVLQANTTGVCNVAVGVRALKSNVCGNRNVAIGVRALEDNTSGGCNVSVGHEALTNNTTGQYNVAVGTDAMATNTIGTCNIGIGYRSLYDNTTGVSNVAMGFSSLENNTTGTCNVAIGHRSLNMNTCGTANTALGSFALCKNTTGVDNVAIGWQTLFKSTTAQQNTAVGTMALACNTVGCDNVAIGSRAMCANTTGNLNVSVGRSALRANTTGKCNTAIGALALTTNTTGFYNTGIGYQALTTNSCGNCNTGLGYRALAQNTTGSNNTAIGLIALQANTTGSNNTAVGYFSLVSNVTGHSNTAVGFKALEDNTSGQSNTAIGFCAMCNNTTGISNTAVGVRAGMLNLYAVKNTAIGESALQNNTVGGHNVAIGYQALVSNAGGVSNVAVGACALYTSLNYYNTAVGANAGKLQGTQSAKYNIYLGYNAGCNLTTGAGNVTIGTVQPESNTGNRQLKIAGYDGSSTTTWIKGDSSGNLIVAGTVTANGQLLSGVTKPTISSISPTVVTNAQSAITITGANFVSIPQVEFLNPSTGIYYLADSVAFSNSTTITVTATLPVDGSYKIRIENGDGEAVLSGSILTVSDTPTFSTAAGSLGTFEGGFSGTIATISASSDSTIAFSETTSVLSGAGVSLNTSTGALTTTDLGGSSTTPTTYNFTLRATDGEGQTADRTFSLTTTFGSQGGAQFN